MAKSMRSKIKKKWRAVKRDKLEEFERKKLEEFNRKLLEIAQTPLKSGIELICSCYFYIFKNSN